MRSFLSVCAMCCATVHARGMATHPDHLSGGAARVTICVVDEEGNPVAEAKVGGHFQNWVKPDYVGDIYSQHTDGDGRTVVTGRAYGYMRVHASKPGHYRSEIRLQYPDTPTTLHRPMSWPDWVATNTVVLKRILNPVPMYVRQIREIKPTHSEWWGYDMLVGDWTPPLGDGETRDIEVRYDLEVFTTNRVGVAREFDANIFFRFPGSGNGIQQVLQDTTSGSSYRMLYEAPLDGYVSQVAFRRTILLGRLQTNANRDQCHYFRVRTKKDADGNILHALYGKMPGDLTEAWVYWLNPDGTRNVEFDPDRNLFPPVRRYEGKFGP